MRAGCIAERVQRFIASARPLPACLRARRWFDLSEEIEVVQLHHLHPCLDEVGHAALPFNPLGIDLGNGPELTVGAQVVPMLVSLRAIGAGTVSSHPDGRRPVSCPQ